MMYDGHWGMGYGVGLGMVIFLVLIVVLAYVFSRLFMTRKVGTESVAETPMDILKKRYARGELAKEDFDRMKREIEQ